MMSRIKPRNFVGFFRSSLYQICLYSSVIFATAALAWSQNLLQQFHPFTFVFALGLVSHRDNRCHYFCGKCWRVREQGRGLRQYSFREPDRNVWSRKLGRAHSWGIRPYRQFWCKLDDKHRKNKQNSTLSIHSCVPCFPRTLILGILMDR